MRKQQKATMFPPLDLAHWPEPQRCKQCGRLSAYTAGLLTVCVSQQCDPHALWWLALDRWHRKRAGKEPLQLTAADVEALRDRRKATKQSASKTARTA